MLYISCNSYIEIEICHDLEAIYFKRNTSVKYAAM